MATVGRQRMQCAQQGTTHHGSRSRTSIPGGTRRVPGHIRLNASVRLRSDVIRPAQTTSIDQLAKVEWPRSWRGYPQIQGPTLKKVLFLRRVAPPMLKLSTCVLVEGRQVFV